MPQSGIPRSKKSAANRKTEDAAAARSGRVLERIERGEESDDDGISFKAPRSSCVCGRVWVACVCVQTAGTAPQQWFVIKASSPPHWPLKSSVSSLADAAAIRGCRIKAAGDDSLQQQHRPAKDGVRLYYIARGCQFRQSSSSPCWHRSPTWKPHTTPHHHRPPPVPKTGGRRVDSKGRARALLAPARRLAYRAAAAAFACITCHSTAASHSSTRTVTSPPHT
jgi:hypothetical protein